MIKRLIIPSHNVGIDIVVAGEKVSLAKRNDGSYLKPLIYSKMNSGDLQ